MMIMAPNVEPELKEKFSSQVALIDEENKGFVEGVGDEDDARVMVEFIAMGMKKSPIPAKKVDFRLKKETSHF